MTGRRGHECFFRPTGLVDDGVPKESPDGRHGRIGRRRAAQEEHDSKENYEAGAVESVALLERRRHEEWDCHGEDASDDEDDPHERERAVHGES